MGVWGEYGTKELGDPPLTSSAFDPDGVGRELETERRNFFREELSPIVDTVNIVELEETAIVVELEETAIIVEMMGLVVETSPLAVVAMGLP